MSTKSGRNSRRSERDGDNEMGSDPAIVLPLTNTQFIEAKPAGGDTSIVRDVVALLSGSLDPPEAPVSPDAFVPVKISTESVRVVLAMRFLSSLVAAMFIICPCLAPLRPIFIMFWA